MGPTQVLGEKVILGIRIRAILIKATGILVKAMGVVIKVLISIPVKINHYIVQCVGNGILELVHMGIDVICGIFAGHVQIMAK